MARSDPQVNIRMPAELKERLEQARQKSNRSLNGEIVHRLALSLDRDDVAAEHPLPPRALPEGAVIDHGVEVWAERLLKPGNRRELEALLATIRAMLSSAGM